MRKSQIRVYHHLEESGREHLERLKRDYHYFSDIIHFLLNSKDGDYYSETGKSTPVFLSFQSAIYSVIAEHYICLSPNIRNAGKKGIAYEKVSRKDEKDRFKVIWKRSRTLPRIFIFRGLEVHNPFPICQLSRHEVLPFQNLYSCHVIVTIKSKKDPAGLISQTHKIINLVYLLLVATYATIIQR